MNILSAVQAIPGSLHDLSESTSAVWFFYVIIGTLILVIAWFIVRDRNDIATSLSKLAQEFGEFRKDLARNYVTRHDLDKVETKIDKHIEHGIVRREQERRAIEDAEA